MRKGPWKPGNRNWDGIQHEKLRRKVDPKYNAVHDELADCFYNSKPFRNYGMLTQETFDKLHALIFWKRDVEFHKENQNEPPQDKIPENEYEDMMDENGNRVKKSEYAQVQIDKLKVEGLELEI